jgi:DNA-binding transcriptional ArsR family regulator
MGAKPAYRDRPAVEVDILDALVDRAGEGMTVLELRAAVGTDIDRIESALAALKDDGLIVVDDTDGTVRIRPADEVVPDPTADTDPDEPSLLETLRDRLGL